MTSAAPEPLRQALDQASAALEESGEEGVDVRRELKVEGELQATTESLRERAARRRRP